MRSNKRKRDCKEKGRHEKAIDEYKLEKLQQENRQWRTKKRNEKNELELIYKQKTFFRHSNLNRVIQRKNGGKQIVALK